MNSSRHPLIKSESLKKNGPVVKERMLFLFNDCLRENKVPKEWKNSIISILQKPDQSATQLCSYRPFSMTLCIARLQIDGHFCEETHGCGGNGLAAKSKETLYSLEIKNILTLSIEFNKVKS
jgi:hypothetical protein